MFADPDDRELWRLEGSTADDSCGSFHGSFMTDAGGGSDASAKGDAVEKFQHDDVARLSSAVLRPRPDAASKHTWLSELGTSVAARVRDCLHCGSGSAVRKLLTQTDTELDIHVRVLRVKTGEERGVGDLRGWMVLQQAVREKIASDGALGDLPAPCFEAAERPAAQAIEFYQCMSDELPEQLKRAGVTTVEDGRRTVCFVVVVGPPTDEIRTHMEEGKSSSFIVSMVPPPDDGDADAGMPTGLSKLEQLKWRKSTYGSVVRPPPPHLPALPLARSVGVSC